ncbi:HAMP domain-containing protein [Rheinheimera sp. D18]|uniref:ATP-binding protein n=1 Tax=Rheinheimera sp. D18 TaxID=2545632 RepID=UPI0010460159|nr:ATP-binding protein [Rheinheimera sp. D18]QBL10135.1 HAMP domain-containing protein [Rheinheimera sp. D18]
MNWLGRLNPFNYLAGRIFLWFWLVLITAVFGTLALSRAVIEQTEIRRLPQGVIQQLQQQIQPFADSQNSAELQQRLQERRPNRWLLVNADSNTVLTPELLPRDFDQHWLTELSQLSLPRWLKHHNTSLAGPFILKVGQDTVALYQKRERSPQPWWQLSEMPQHVLLMLTLLISAIASFILAISISRPLRELLQRNLQFADGALNSRVTNLNKRKDELGQLGHSFNTMAERISTLLTNQQRLLRDISHELRSPLARAQLALGLTERQQNLEQIPRLKQELDRLDIMLDELLTYSKLDAGQYQLEKQQFDLTELLAEIIDVNQVEADAKQQTIELVAPQQLLINADSRLLARAIENVLRNAIKYSPVHSNISCMLQQHAQQLLITICDQGPGIAESQLEAIFEPFYRVSNSRTATTGGTGLGLAIVTQVIRQHGGQTTATNASVGGLCISLTLPAN